MTVGRRFRWFACVGRIDFVVHHRGWCSSSTVTEFSIPSTFRNLPAFSKIRRGWDHRFTPRSALSYLLLKYLHVLGAIVILGTGTGIAFFMLMAHLSRDTDFIGRTGSVVVQADKLFTATAVTVQPVTGYLLMRETGVPFTEGWMVASLILYGVAGMFWLPVVWIQARMRDLALEAAAAGKPLPQRYHRLFRITAGSLRSFPAHRHLNI
jgi:uncharacterized membrane protein